MEKPNILKSLDFVDMPVSRPLGQVDFDGGELPPLPKERRPDFAPVPESMTDMVMSKLENLDAPPTPIAPSTPHAPVIENINSVEVPTEIPEMDFDLFQFSTLKEIVSKLDIGIKALESSLNELTSKRDMIAKLIKGDTDGN